MIKLYYSEGACSLSPHIVLEELGLPYEAIPVQLMKGEEVPANVNPMGAVPAIVMDNGQPLTEGAAIVQYLADLKPESGLAPRAGTPERYRLQEHLNFIATEMHKGIGALFGVTRMIADAAGQQAVRSYLVTEAQRRIDVASHKLGAHAYLMGKDFTVADAYMFTVLSWCEHLELDLKKWPNLVAYLDRVKNRPAVMKVLKAEDLL
jgi:glutathione S-transferase